MNLDALSAVAVFGGTLTLVLGILYLGAVKSQKRGELRPESIRLLRWALLGQLAIYGILALTAFLV